MSAFPAIWLREEDGRFIVAVEVGKKWIDVLIEVAGPRGGMSHIVESHGIQRCIDLANGIDAGVKP